MFDWWVVQKRTIYLGIALLVVLMLGGAAALYVWKFGNPLKNVGTKVNSRFRRPIHFFRRRCTSDPRGHAANH